MALEIPSHVRFAWSRDDLETAVEDTHEAWWTGEEGRWIGLYKVHGISFDKEGETYIDLGGCGMLDHCWFMYEPQPDSQRHRLATSRMSEHWWLLRDPF
jgi:hypothetical protein